VAQQMITPYRAENWWCIERIFAPKYYGGLLLHCKSPFQLWKFQNPCRIGARGTWWLWSSLLPTKRLLVFWDLISIYLNRDSGTGVH